MNCSKMFGKKTLIFALIVIVIAVFLNFYKSRKELSPIIETKNGKVQGFLSQARNGRAIYEYLGLRFARPPIKELRFEAPQPPEKWDGVHEATAYGNECAQLKLLTSNFDGEEDCLFLNVFTPKERDGKLLPTMVFLHGGAFISGSANGYKGGYLLEEDVVLVTVNYRLAALGFMNTGDGVVQGNMGLKDQTMALQWVKDNIASFGGDPEKVLLFGESAGSASTSFHLLSPMSKGLFHKALLQSGVFTSDWAVNPNPVEQAKRFVKKFDCPTTDTKEMVDCMKKVDARTFVEGHYEVLLPLRDQITLFTPTVETHSGLERFLLDDPKKLLKEGKIHKVPVIAGVNSGEGLLTSAIVTANSTKLAQANSEFDSWIMRILHLKPKERMTEIGRKIKKFYFGDLEDINSLSLLPNYTNIFSDKQFFRPLHKFGVEYSKLASLRLYYYDYEGKFSLARILASSQKGFFPPLVNILYDMGKLWVQEKLGMEIDHPGACHGDELALIFDWPLGPHLTEGTQDYNMSKTLVKLWTSFAKDGTKMEFDSTSWPLINPKDKHLKYLSLCNTESKIIDEPFEHRIDFWDKLNLQ